MKKGYLARTTKGRVATPKAWQKLGLSKSVSHPDELF